MLFTFIEFRIELGSYTLGKPEIVREKSDFFLQNLGKFKNSYFTIISNFLLAVSIQNQYFVKNEWINYY